MCKKKTDAFDLSAREEAEEDGGNPRQQHGLGETGVGIKLDGLCVCEVRSSHSHHCQADQRRA